MEKRGEAAESQGMPRVGFGTYAPKKDEEKLHTAVKHAVRNGYRLLDCAAYYRNERTVGHAVKELITEGTIVREDLFVISKLWNSCHSPELVRPSLKKTLYDLGLKCLDLYLLHWPMGFKEGGEMTPTDDAGNILFSDVDFLDTWQAMEDCVDEGLTKHIGLSNFNSKQITRVLVNARIKPFNLQVEVNIHCQNEKLIEFAKSKNITVTAYCPLAKPSARVNKDRMPMIMEPVLQEIASKKNKTPAQVALRFLIQRGVYVIPKSITPSRIADNIQVFDFELSDDEMREIATLNQNRRVVTFPESKDHKDYPFNEPL